MASVNVSTGFRVYDVAGLFLLVFGSLVFVGLVPLSVTASSVAVDCTNWPTSCSTTAQVANTGTTGFTSPFNAFFVYKNTLGQTVLVDKLPWSSSQASVVDSPATCQPVNTGQPCGFTTQSVPGAGTDFLGFSVNVYFVDSNGVPMGATASTTFSVPIKTQILYGGVGSITVTPPGSSPNQGGTTSGTYIAYWTGGTSITVQTSAGVAPITSAPPNICAASASGTGFTCTFTASSTLPVVTISGSTSASQNAIIVYAVTGGGGVTPLQLCLSATAMTLTVPPLSCGPSQTFTLTPSAAWSVQQQNSGTILKSGSGTTAKMNFTDYSSQVTYSGGLAALNFVTLAPATLSVFAGNGGSVTPAPGLYVCSATSTVCKPGGIVQFVATPATGYQFQDWIVNGQSVSTSPSYAVTIPASGITAVTALFALSGTPCPGCGGGGGSNFGSIGNNIVGGLMMAGGVFVMIYPRTRRAEGGAG